MTSVNPFLFGRFVHGAAVTSLLLALVGCLAPGASPNEGGSDNKSDALIDSSLFATCWMEVEEGDLLETHNWNCEVPSQVAGLEIAFVDFSFHGRSGQMSGGYSGKADSFGGTNPQDQYPVDFIITVPQLRGVIGVPQRHSVTKRIQSARSFTENSPLVVELPYDVWYVDIKNEWPDDALAGLVVEERDASLGDFRDGNSNRGSLPLAQIYPKGDGAVTRAFVIVEKGADSVQATLKFVGSPDLGETTVQFEGTGQYLLSGKQLLKTADSLSDPGTLNPDESQQDTNEPDTNTNESADPACVADFIDWRDNFTIPRGSLTDQGAATMEALFDDVPCAPHGSPEAFSSWLDLANALMLKFLPANGSLSANEEGVMARLGPVAPQNISNDDQYIEFVRIFTERLRQYYPTSHSTLNSEEQTLLDVLIAGVPDASTDAGYTAWFQLFETQLNDAHPSSHSVFDDDERSVLGSILQITPTSIDGSAFELWQALFKERFESAVPQTYGQINESEEELFELLLEASPGRATAAG